MRSHSQAILITGSTGFVGRHLTAALVQHGMEVYGTSRSAAGDEVLRSAGCHPVRIDLERASFPLTPGALPDVGTVFHLAGKLSGSPEEMNAVNQVGTKKIADYYARHGAGTRLIHVSSVAAGGPSSESCPKKESDPSKPISHYGMSKLAGEEIVRQFASSLPSTIIRPGIVFGPGDKEFLRLIKALYRVRLNPLIGTGRQPLAFVEVSDLITLLLRCMDRGERIASDDRPNGAAPILGQGIYNAADAEPLSIYELGRIFREATGRLVLPLRMPASLAWCLGALGEGTAKLTRMSSTLTRDKIREATASGWWVSPEKAARQLDWAPKMPLRETMKAWIVDCMHQGLL
ncbi:dTDP-6-deoxy-L-talose 4-dehydrogenase (NAD(P)(+)) [Pirellula sp. SH-Sr6A]|uniref:NAD-dependent epimerase/dehydratase family protein n=1 Tax=Pirellula sp. SH-Sr6A TaxID=1632865 RepID=UPI00078C372A|nr:NAD-dependent epimerase/dehydratase family protein [Pirellula sp. SH-Sr6A]AMV30467.1 dTDP-6-deoxy-L-talose 4-dehydrogenase (NAD(P)(+)) [Pirellula sp. SH-Sr6A]